MVFSELRKGESFQIIFQLQVTENLLDFFLYISQNFLNSTTHYKILFCKTHDVIVHAGFFLG